MFDQEPQRLPESEPLTKKRGKGAKQRANTVDRPSDAFGNEITDVRYVEVFRDREEFIEIIKHARGLEARIRRLADTAGGKGLHRDELRLTRIKDELECRTPFCICVACSGAQLISGVECGACGGYGWMTCFSYGRFIALRNKKPRVSSVLNLAESLRQPES